MSSNWSSRLRLSVFGESHGAGIGVVLDGLPAGETVDMDILRGFMLRRAPGRGKESTPRREADEPEFLSGIQNGATCGTPLAVLIRNTDTRSSDYERTAALARPGHADYTGYVRYGGHNDIRGGGHFSGRITAPLVAAGGIALQILARRGVHIGAHLLRVGGVEDSAYPETDISADLLLSPGKRAFPVLDEARGEQMRAAIEQARMEGDSVGGVVECGAVGLPAGLGSPMFGGAENVLSSLLFAIPALKGLEFGEGFRSADARGSHHNDPFYMQGDGVRTSTNHHGGILGGITSGMPLLLRAAFKPTPSIALTQDTVDYIGRHDARLQVKGRHDPCLAVRAVPCVEAAVALGLLDLMLEREGNA